MRDVSFDRPVRATLVVRLENGDEFEPTTEDLHKFGLEDPFEAYDNFRKNLCKAIGWDVPLDNSDDLSMLNYFVQRCILYCGVEGLGDFTCSDDDETLEEVRTLLGKLDWDRSAR